MLKTPYAMKISPVTKARLKGFCDERGIKQGHFVEKAIEEKLEREENLEDALEFKRWKHLEPHATDYQVFVKELLASRKRAR